MSTPSTKGKVCPNCGATTDILRSAIKNGVYISERCENCLAHYKPIADFARKYNRDRGKEDYRKDIIQRFEGTEINPEFVDAYPKESAAQWGDEILRGYTQERKQY